MAGNNWKEVSCFPDERTQKALMREFEFSDFASALAFTNKIGELAEQHNHHPDISLSWGLVKVWLTTHSEHAITDKDHELAKLIDQL